MQELYLRKNQISDLNEIQHLQGLKNLKVLWLASNPCADENPNYRRIVLSMLPHLTKLDNVEVSDEERQDAARFSKEEAKGQRKGSKTVLNDKSNSRHSPITGGK